MACPSIGAIRFDLASRSISAFPKEGLDQDSFERHVIHEWLPLVYQGWGFQVLHASAAVYLPARRVVAFSGPAGAGKSTLGFGLGLRPGWQQIADECMVMTVSEKCIRLVPIPNSPRLRAASASHYCLPPADHNLLGWPEFDMGLDHVFFLHEALPHKETEPPHVHISPLDETEAYTLLLQQAFALTLKIRQHSQRLMRDYLQVACQVDAHRLFFPKSFSTINEILDVVESLALSSDPAGS